VGVIAMLVSQTLGIPSLPAPLDCQSSPYLTPFQTSASASLYAQVEGILGVAQVDSLDQEFIKTVSTFYAQLAESQEPLGGDFQRVLDEHLWDLYEE
jgi:hypothetical protein